MPGRHQRRAARRRTGAGGRIVALILLLIMLGGLALIVEGVWLKATLPDAETPAATAFVSTGESAV